MTLHEYFENETGTGVLATADSEGIVDVAIYARPHVIDEETVAFIMSARRSHKNLETNPHAAYLFKTDGSGHEGKRLYLTKTGEDRNMDLINRLRRRKRAMTPGRADDTASCVYFRINEIRPLIGDND